jgi:hypothetical protein
MFGMADSRSRRPNPMPARWRPAAAVPVSSVTMSGSPSKHRPLATRFGHDTRVSEHRLLALRMLGYRNAALADADHALRDAREIGQAPTLMAALFFAWFPNIICGNYTAADALADELFLLAEEKRSLMRKGGARLVEEARIGPDWQSLRRNPIADIRSRRMAVNGINTVGVSPAGMACRRSDIVYYSSWNGSISAVQVVGADRSAVAGTDRNRMKGSKLIAK